ncbi:MAG TPA: hypothetical protein VFI62_17025, partial [Burkholderiales bacterium]|nr:hypothetical protein [Burkholderiales bacterium]
MHGPDPSLFFRGLDLRRSFLREPCRGILHGLDRWEILRRLGRFGLRPRVFLGRPGLELLEHGFAWRLIDLGPGLSGRFGSSSGFLARRR